MTSNLLFFLYFWTENIFIIRNFKRMKREDLMGSYQLEHKSTAKYFASFFGLLLFVAMIFPMIWIEIKPLGYILFGLAFISYLLFVRYFPLLNVVGRLHLKESGLMIDTEEFSELNWNEIALFKIDFWGYRSGWFTQTSMGNENVVSVKDINGREMTWFMHIRDKHEFRKLQSWLEVAYKNGIQVEESVGEGKSYCLRRMKYAEIQKFKTKYFETL